MCLDSPKAVHQSTKIFADEYHVTAQRYNTSPINIMFLELYLILIIKNLDLQLRLVSTGRQEVLQYC